MVEATKVWNTFYPNVLNIRNYNIENIQEKINGINDILS